MTMVLDLFPQTRPSALAVEFVHKSPNHLYIIQLDDLDLRSLHTFRLNRPTRLHSANQRFLCVEFERSVFLFVQLYWPMVLVH